MRGGQRTLRGFVTVVGAKEPSNARDSAGGEDVAPTPALDSAVAAANSEPATTDPLLVARTLQLDPSAAAAATAATDSPRAALGKRTASEADDADEA